MIVDDNLTADLPGVPYKTIKQEGERMARELKKSLEIAHEIVVSFWREKLSHDAGDIGMIAELYRVQSAKPEELAKDYEAIQKIMTDALKQIREEKE